MKPCKMKKHLISVHPEKKDKPFEFFQKLRCFPETDHTDAYGSRKATEIRQRNCCVVQVSIIISDVMKLAPEETVQAIPLSNSTVCRRIDEMAGDIEGQLICLLKSRSFSLQLDETTLQDSDALLMAYVRFFNAKELVEEMLFARRIRVNTKGAAIFEEIRGYFEEIGIPMENIIACATAVVPSVFIHCVVHREHLVLKMLGLSLNYSLSLVIQAFAGILKDEDLLAYVSHLKQVIEDMKERFCDLLNLDIPSWILDPFGVRAVEVHPEIQEELIELQSDVIARHPFGQFDRGFWIKHDLPNKFPTL
uniref:Zinc finger BED domain-containing protein 5 n=1 Tax=Trichuris muris TaxID=70415 RepID=A0A5S6QEW7_TRIMR